MDISILLDINHFTLFLKLTQSLTLQFRPPQKKYPTFQFLLRQQKQKKSPLVLTTPLVLRNPNYFISVLGKDQSLFKRTFEPSSTHTPAAPRKKGGELPLRKQVP